MYPFGQYLLLVKLVCNLFNRTIKKRNVVQNQLFANIKSYKTMPGALCAFYRAPILL